MAKKPAGTVLTNWFERMDIFSPEDEQSFFSGLNAHPRSDQMMRARSFARLLRVLQESWDAVQRKWLTDFFNGRDSLTCENSPHISVVATSGHRYLVRDSAL
jgi:hypothetical protein